MATLGILRRWLHWYFDQLGRYFWLFAEFSGKENVTGYAVVGRHLRHSSKGSSGIPKVPKSLKNSVV